MVGPVLYSTNPWFTEIVCDQYRGGRYGLLWCSEFFDPASHGSHSPAALIPPSSSPKPLYYDVLKAVQTNDGGNQKIKDYRRTFNRLAWDWHSKAEITQSKRDEIIALVRARRFTIWQPRLFVLPREPLEKSGRLHLVPVAKRAGIGKEFQVAEPSSTLLS